MIRLLSFALILSAFLTSLSAEAQTRVRRNVEIEWEAVDSATAYEVEVTRRDSEKKPSVFRTRSSRWSATIKPGIYDMRIRSFDGRGVPGDWSPPSELRVKLPAIIALSPTRVVQASSPEREEVEFRWEPVPGAAKYRVSIETEGFKEDFETDGTSKSVKLPVARRLAWRAVAIDPKGEVGDEWSEALLFELIGPELVTPQISRPLTPYLKEMKWSPSSHAESYAYSLSRWDAPGKRWQRVVTAKDLKDAHLDLDISRPSGRYRLRVSAHAPLRRSSKEARLDFDFHGGFRDPAALDQAILRESIAKPTHYYAIASYLITNITYTSVNYDDNSRGSFDALGGTGRVGLGYQNANSNWGGFGIVDLSGFTIGGRNFSFASIEAHLTRKLEFGQSGLLLFGTGLFSKELPIVQGTSLGGLEGVGKVRTLGPHAGFTYWMPLTDRVGLQMNARAYYTLIGEARGQSAESSLSLQYGLLGSYRLTPRWMGYAGYAFRKDRATYAANPADPDSSAIAGQENFVEISGHYLNLILDFSF